MMGRLEGGSNYGWKKSLKKAAEADMYSVIALHHHIIPVPKTGRERNVLADAGDVLCSIVKGGANLVICGHKHVPHLWRVEDIFFVTAGTVASLKLRGKDINSYNTYYIEDDMIEIKLNQVQRKSYLMGSYKLYSKK
jgi:Predicted phosphohydrolases